jgi:hypothetical protein
MVALNSKFDILRGWPNSSAVQEDFVIGGTSAHGHRQGEWVSLASTTDGSMKTDDSLPSSAPDKVCYLIIEGLDDHSSKFANRVTCLLGGGYMVRIPEVAPDAFAGGTEYRCFGAVNDAQGNPVNQTAAEFTVGSFAAVAAGKLVPHGQRDGVEVGQVVAVNVNNGTIDLLVF